MSGRERRSRQSATRRFSPPEIFVTSASGGGQRSASIAVSSVRSSSQPFAASIASCTLPYSAMTLSISASGRLSPIFSPSSSKRARSALSGPTPSSTFPRTVFFGSSWGSCERWPMRMPSAGNASPVNSLSSPAMMRRTVDLPAPFSPRMPILAPGKNER